MDKVLAIEDDPAVQRALRRTFETAGFDITIAADGTSAMDVFRATMPRVVILDLRLPGRSGQDICREIKRLAASVPILVLSAASDVVDKVLLLELGADDYVTKPFSPRELLARVRAAIRRLNQTPDKSETLQLRRCGSEFLQDGAVEGGEAGASDSAGIQDAALLPEQRGAGGFARRTAERGVGLQQLSHHAHRGHAHLCACGRSWRKIPANPSISAPSMAPATNLCDKASTTSRGDRPSGLEPNS